MAEVVTFCNENLDSGLTEMDYDYSGDVEQGIDLISSGYYIK